MGFHSARSSANSGGVLNSGKKKKNHPFPLKRRPRGFPVKRGSPQWGKTSFPRRVQGVRCKIFQRCFLGCEGRSIPSGLCGGTIHQGKKRNPKGHSFPIEKTIFIGVKPMNLERGEVSIWRTSFKKGMLGGKPKEKQTRAFEYRNCPAGGRKESQTRILRKGTRAGGRR